MSRISELIEEGKRHQVTFKNSAGKTFLTISLLWVVIIFVAQPQLLVLLLILFALEIVDVQIDDRKLRMEDI